MNFWQFFPGFRGKASVPLNHNLDPASNTATEGDDSENRGTTD